MYPFPKAYISPYVAPDLLLKRFMFLLSFVTFLEHAIQSLPEIEAIADWSSFDDTEPRKREFRGSNPLEYVKFQN